MTNQLVEIYGRLRALRIIMDVPAEQMAKALNVQLDEYCAYEEGQRDFSFSFLRNAAEILAVDIMDLLSGESPRLTTCALVRDGQGFDIAKPEAYDYKHLAFTFSNKKAEPFMVSVEPAQGEPTLHAHEGQEFVYMVAGQMEFRHDGAMYELNAGDSVYFNSGLEHAMKALNGQAAKFISVVMK